MREGMNAAPRGAPSPGAAGAADTTEHINAQDNAKIAGVRQPAQETSSTSNRSAPPPGGGANKRTEAPSDADSGGSGTEAPPGPDAAEITRTVALLHHDGLRELRALASERDGAFIGYFDEQHRPELVQAAVRLNRNGHPVYITANPCDADLLGRAANRVRKAKKGEGTGDKDITARRLLIIDVDPKRATGIAATEAELAAAQAKALAIRDHLRSQGWPDPVMTCSGNGAHLYYGVKLPNDPASLALVDGCLKALGARFDDPAVKVDQTVKNAARIVRLHGTVNNKGDHLPERPHRLSFIHPEHQAPPQTVALDLLQKLAGEVQASKGADTKGHQQRRSQGAYTGPAFDVEDFMRRAGLEGSPHDWSGGGTCWPLEKCPFNSDHVDGSAAIMRKADGTLAFKCQHDSCEGKRWQDLRELVDGKRESRGNGADAGHAREQARSTRDGQKRTETPEEEHQGDTEADSMPDAAAAALAGLRPVHVVPGFYDIPAVQDELLKLGILYQQHGRLGRVIRLGAKEVEAAKLEGINRTEGALVIANVSSHYLELLMSRAMCFQRYDKRTEQWVTRDPPTKWALALQAAVDEWRFPALNGVVTAPFLRPDGTLVQAPGYDRASGIYADFRPGDFPHISEAPTLEDAKRAVALLKELLNEFPFSEVDRDNHVSAVIAAYVTAAVRRALPIAPGIAVNATVASSGKTTLLELAGIIVTGNRPATTDYPAEEEEMLKRLLTFCMDGEQFVLFDNVPRGQVVDSAKLNAVITAETFKARKLGVNESGAAPTTVFWMVNGNSLQVGGDITTRLLYASLAPQTETPEERAFSRDIHAYALKHRGALLAACLTIVLAYRAAGHPAVDIKGGYRFAVWHRMVRCAIRWAGLPDPLLTQKLIKAADPEKGELESVLTELRRVFGAEWFTASDVMRKAGADGPTFAEPDQGLMDVLKDVSPPGAPEYKELRAVSIRACGPDRGGA